MTTSTRLSFKDVDIGALHVAVETEIRRIKVALPFVRSKQGEEAAESVQTYMTQLEACLAVIKKGMAI